MISYRHDARVCFPFLEELCSLAGLSTCSRNAIAVCAEFMSHDHCCHLLQHVDLSGRPEAPTIEEFKHSIGKTITATHFSWQEDQQDGATSAEVSPFVTFAVSAQWSFGSVTSTDFQRPQVRCAGISVRVYTIMTKAWCCIQLQLHGLSFCRCLLAICRETMKLEA